MKYYREGVISYLIYEDEHVIQEKKWWGWETILRTYSEEKVKRVREQIEKSGGIFI